MGDEWSLDDFRALYFGDFKREPPHPTPWMAREGRSFRERVFVITDANRKCVAEFTDRVTAEEVAAIWNSRFPPATKGEPK